MTYYAMERGWMDHPLFEGDEYSRAQAWEWLVADAAWKETKKRIMGQMITLKRAQLSHSYRFLAEKWGWSLGKVQRFIKDLKSESMIDTQTDTGQVTITICNYDKYQSPIKTTDTPTDTVTDTAAIQKRYKEEEGKEDKKEDNIHLARAHEFLHWWQLYPNKVGKPVAEKSYRAARTKASAEQLLEGLRLYIREKPPDRSYCNPATWLNQERWTDEPANPAKEIPNGNYRPAPKRPAIDIIREQTLAARAAREQRSAEQAG
jgi:hypothetical protein